MRKALLGCDTVIHLAALHPLVAPPEADEATYREANVVPFVALLAVSSEVDVRRVILASSTSVWRDSARGSPARFLDESVPPDADDPYARSKRACEDLLARSRFEGVVLRLARFTSSDTAEDEVRKLYRAVDPIDAAAAVALAAEHARSGSVYAVSAPTPFVPEDAALLANDPRAAIRLRTGQDPSWVPERIGSVVISARILHELGWHPAHPSALMPISR
jgi:nucleoside-diphosphate-sugar epimerase